MDATIINAPQLYEKRGRRSVTLKCIRRKKGNEEIDEMPSVWMQAAA